MRVWREEVCSWIQSINDVLISEKNLVCALICIKRMKMNGWDKHRHLKIFISVAFFSFLNCRQGFFFFEIQSLLENILRIFWGYQMCCSFSFPIGDEFFWSGKNYSSWKGPSREPPFLHTISQHCIHTCDRRERDENPIYFSLAEAIYFHSFNFFLLCFFSSSHNFFTLFLFTFWCDIEKEFFNLNAKKRKFCYRVGNEWGVRNYFGDLHTIKLQMSRNLSSILFFDPITSLLILIDTFKLL